MCDLKEQDGSQQPNWLCLDDLIMEKIFEQLPFRDRFNASLVRNKAPIIFPNRILSKANENTASKR